MITTAILTIDGHAVEINGEKNLLELIRKAHVELPTFCYHSELSIYGACRLCMVEVEGRGLVAACSTPPEPGMAIRTQTGPVRELRKTNLELLLASGNHDCPTCGKSGSCKLQSLAERLGVTKVRFKAPREERPIDTSSPSIVRDPNRCVLCGDCVRVCSEIQGLGVLDFVNRGSQITVGPAFNKGLDQVDCVACGQCAAVCPTGALLVKSDVDRLHAALEDPTKKVVIQVAPAVRVAIGENFNLPSSPQVMGMLASALRRLGFDRVYDTAFAADLTVVEEAHEFLQRKAKNRNLPLFTSCCPAWVKLAEQDFPELLPRITPNQVGYKTKVEHLSSCRSPQQMFGSVAKKVLPVEMGIQREDLVVVALMPCTAKKFEARRDEFKVRYNPDVDIVITTQEIIRMIQSAGLSFGDLEPESLDQPFGSKSGAGIIFGNSGGVTEAVLRYLVDNLQVSREGREILDVVRSDKGRREFTVDLPIGTVKAAVVHGLGNARALVEEISDGRAEFDFVEVMACPGGCVSGAGQPTTGDTELRRKRTTALRRLDVTMDTHRPQENPALDKLYAEHLEGHPGSHEAHRMLHTYYSSRKRIQSEGLSFSEVSGKPRIPVSVCLGTSCHLRGSQDLLRQLLQQSDSGELMDKFEIRGTFCMEACELGPSVHINDSTIHHATLDKVLARMEEVQDDEPVSMETHSCFR
jgi:NADH-quinone oxidoreductase subunit G